jgi:hypothetical protein
MNPLSHSNFGMAFVFWEIKKPLNKRLKNFYKDHITFPRRKAFHYLLMKIQ